MVDKELFKKILVLLFLSLLSMVSFAKQTTVTIFKFEATSMAINSNYYFVSKTPIELYPTYMKIENRRFPVLWYVESENTLTFKCLNPKVGLFDVTLKQTDKGKEMIVKHGKQCHYVVKFKVTQIFDNENTYGDL